MTIARYGMGFVLSLVLTLIAFSLAVWGDGGISLLFLLGILAVGQLVIQLEFFLHMGSEATPRYRIMAFWFMATTLLIIIIGSIWIMTDLNHRMMHFTPEQKRDYMQIQSTKGF